MYAKIRSLVTAIAAPVILAFGICIGGSMVAPSVAAADVCVLGGLVEVHDVSRPDVDVLCRDKGRAYGRYHEVSNDNWGCNGNCGNNGSYDRDWIAEWWPVYAGNPPWPCRSVWTKYGEARVQDFEPWREIRYEDYGNGNMRFYYV